MKPRRGQTAGDNPKLECQNPNQFPNLEMCRPPLSRQVVCPTMRFVGSLLWFFRMHWDHEPRTTETAPPTCCRHLAGSAFLRLVCRQDAGRPIGEVQKSTRLNSSLTVIFDAVFSFKK